MLATWPFTLAKVEEKLLALVLVSEIIVFIASTTAYSPPTRLVVFVKSPNTGLKVESVVPVLASIGVLYAKTNWKGVVVAGICLIFVRTVVKVVSPVSETLPAPVVVKSEKFPLIFPKFVSRFVI